MPHSPFQPASGRAVRPSTLPPYAGPCRQPAWLAAGLASASLLLALGAMPAQAGSVTAESVWDRTNAIQRARSQLPAGASVTRTQCTEVNVRDGNYRYICTLDYADPIPAAAPRSLLPIEPQQAP